MKGIFKQNALIAIACTVFIVGISFLFGKTARGIMVSFVLTAALGIHFMIMGILMAVSHFKGQIEKRKGYMASFAFIWLWLVLVNVAYFYFT